MAISYKKLWKLLIDCDLKKKQRELYDEEDRLVRLRRHNVNKKTSC